jgi:hypothetical protein
LDDWLNIEGPLARLSREPAIRLQEVLCFLVETLLSDMRKFSAQNPTGLPDLTLV